MTVDAYPWSAGFRSLEEEHDYRLDEIDGQVPATLRGTLFHNGSGRNQLAGHWFPHWFDGNFKKFNDDPSKLPFDQHCLIALCAPRPVLVPNAEEDLWANPSGQLEMLKAATPVYQLLGVEGLATGVTPELNKLIDSRLGYVIRPGKHAMTRADWEVFLTYADKWLKR